MKKEGEVGRRVFSQHKFIGRGWGQPCMGEVEAGCVGRGAGDSQS